MTTPRRFVVYLRTPKGDRRLEQVATSPREALQEAFGTLSVYLFSDLPDNARCRLECDGQVLGFCPDELGVLNGALHADDDVLDPRPGRTTKTASAPPQGSDIWKTIMNDLMRDAARKALENSIRGVFDNIITRPASPNVQQWPSPEQRLHGGPRTYDPPDARSYAAGGTVMIDDQTYTITSVDGGVAMADSIVPPPAPSAPASGSTTDAPERTPEP